MTNATRQKKTEKAKEPALSPVTGEDVADCRPLLVDESPDLAPTAAEAAADAALRKRLAAMELHEVVLEKRRLVQEYIDSASGDDTGTKRVHGVFVTYAFGREASAFGGHDWLERLAAHGWAEEAQSLRTLAEKIRPHVHGLEPDEPLIEHARAMLATLDVLAAEFERTAPDDAEFLARVNAPAEPAPAADVR